MELYLESDCSDLDYTVVRPPGLGDGPLSGMTWDTHNTSNFGLRP